MPRSSNRIELGLAVMGAVALPGQRYSCDEIAAFCECDEETIRNIEKKALAKMGKLLKRESVGVENLATSVNP